MNGLYEIGLSYNEIPCNNTRSITLFVGNNTITRSLPLNNSFTNTKIYIGTDSDGNNALMGMIMDVYFKKEYTTSIPSSITNRVGYHKNHYYDSFGRMKEYSLYKNNNELLNPILLRFITPDSLEYLDSSSIIGLNLYVYCGNDPVNMKDENGDFGIFATLLICTVIGLVVGTGISTGKEIKEHGSDLSQWDFGKVGDGALLMDFQKETK